MSYPLAEAAKFICWPQNLITWPQGHIRSPQDLSLTP